MEIYRKQTAVLNLRLEAIFHHRKPFSWKEGLSQEFKRQMVLAWL